MGLGAVNAAPCVHGRRSARGAVNKRPQAAARANHRRHSAPLRTPHRVGTIHYATQRARAASGARRALRRACSGKWQMGGYMVYKPQVFGRVRHIERPCLGVHQGRRALRVDTGRYKWTQGAAYGRQGPPQAAAAGNVLPVRARGLI